MDAVYVKTVLRMLRNLEKITKQIDGLIFDKAICTSTRLSDCAFNSAEKQIDRVLKLMQKKNNLINLKLIADEHLDKLDKELSYVLKMRFIDLKKPDEISECLCISPRTYFRYMEKACQSLGKQMALSGYDEKWFEENYFDQRWIRSLYERIAEGAKSSADE